MRLIVIVVTADRRATLGQALAQLGTQTRLPDLLVEAMLPDVGGAERHVAAVGPGRSHVVVASRVVVVGGGKQLGAALEAQAGSLDAVGDDDDPGRYDDMAPAGAYGCNMAFRATDIRQHRFDERLPLYGWQEDTDFSRLVARGRPIVRLHGLRGVHLGVKRGRVSGVRFGYSQIANPVYLTRKGTGTRRWAARLMGSNVLANVTLSFRAEHEVDRLGRLRGNLIAVGHWIRGRLDPEYIMRL